MRHLHKHLEFQITHEQCDERFSLLMQFQVYTYQHQQAFITIISKTYLKFGGVDFFKLVPISKSSRTLPLKDFVEEWVMLSYDLKDFWTSMDENCLGLRGLKLGKILGFWSWENMCKVKREGGCSGFIFSGLRGHARHELSMLQHGLKTRVLSRDVMPGHKGFMPRHAAFGNLYGGLACRGMRKTCCGMTLFSALDLLFHSCTSQLCFLWSYYHRKLQNYALHDKNTI